jgi:hypothetical protein
MSPDVQNAAVQHEDFDVKTPVYDPEKMKAVVQRDKAAIPEASTPSRKSKRRAQSTDEHSLDRAERIKAVRNLDFTSEKGNISMSQTLFVQLSHENVI